MKIAFSTFFEIRKRKKFISSMRLGLLRNYNCIEFALNSEIEFDLKKIYDPLVRSIGQKISSENWDFQIAFSDSQHTVISGSNRVQEAMCFVLFKFRGNKRTFVNS